MTAVLSSHAYGKTGIRLAKVERAGAVHSFYDLTLAITLTGDFAGAYLEGDNSTSLPTDTMRATTYALAKDMTLAETEPYLVAVGRRLLEATPVATAASVEAVIHGWQRLGEGHPHAFTQRAGDGTATVTVPRVGEPEVTSGLTDLVVAKTTASGYTGFLKDEYTVLAETGDRIMATSVTADWTYLTAPASYDATRRGVRAVLEDVFSHQHSLAVQHTMYAMGEAVLGKFPDLADISFRMPNRHHVPVDLTPFGRTNDNEVFVVLDRPYGDIRATVSREA